MKRSFNFVKMLKQDFHCGQLDSDGHLRIATSTVDLVGGTGSGVVDHELSIQSMVYHYIIFNYLPLPHLWLISFGAILTVLLSNL